MQSPPYIRAHAKTKLILQLPAVPGPLVHSNLVRVAILRLLLGGGGLGGLFLVTPHHDHADEGADDGGGEDNEEDGDADGPDARGEEGVEDVVGVDEGLWVC
ncbi:hypothetical protein IMZ48_02005 [Candidatus Bathyarchaeota archaeon]|nr:hypothetical protein [Candidatus Bathyarchaeota archaeon]